MLWVEAAILIALAAALAWPVPTALARAAWTARSPRPALVLWQAVGLGGGLSILGAGLTLAAASLSHHWASGLAALADAWSRLGVLGWTGVALTVLLGLWLVAVAAVSSARVVMARRVHRYRLDAVSQRLPFSRLVAGVHLLDHPAAVAYCLPGLRPRIVVSSGALEALSPEELDAVVAHERAHARGRHDLVVQPFVAWRQTFPFLPAAGEALAAVDLLVEMLADDTARRTCPPNLLQGALDRLAATGAGDGQLMDQVAARCSRLDQLPRPLPRPVQILLYTAAAALVALPPIVLLLS